MCFMYQSIFDLFMKNGEGAFNLFSSVAVESLQFFSSFAWTFYKVMIMQCQDKVYSADHHSLSSARFLKA